MKKVILPALLLSLTMFSACNGNGKSDGQANSEADSTAVVNETLDNSEVEDMMSLINNVSLCLDSIQEQEKVVLNIPNEGNVDKQKILIQLHAFKDLLARKQQQINELTQKSSQQNAKAKKTIENLQNMVEYLNAQLAEKAERIAKLENLLQRKDVKIDELRYNVNELSKESDYLKEQNYQQDKEINSRYYCMGSKKELSEKGLLKKGGFLKKKKVDNAAIDKSLFKRVDVRSFKTLKIDAKKPKLLSGNPEGSYTITPNGDGTSTLTVVDAEKFWNASDYLIIQL